MSTLRVIHLVAVFIWLGGLLSITRLFGYHVKESIETQMRLVALYKRMYNLVQFPMMLVTVITGLTMLLWSPALSQGWFHMKLTFVIGLIVCDTFCRVVIRRLSLEPDLGRGIQYKMLHGFAGLFLIGIAIAIGAIKPHPQQQNAENKVVAQQNGWQKSNSSV